MRRIITIWLCLVLVTSSAFVLVGVEDGVAEGKIVVKDGVTYTTHAPIRIDSDADFGIGINGVSAGNGSAGNPWIIEGWDIDGTGYENCIYIGNTTDYFVVRDSNLYDAEKSELYLYYVQNSSLTNNIVSLGSFYGIYLLYSENNTLTYNQLSANHYAIYLWHSENNRISNNNVLAVYSYYQGITIRESDNSIINNNTVIGYRQLLRITDSDNNTIENNTLDWCSVYAAYFYNSNNNLISNNNLSNNDDGIMLTSSDNNIVKNNNASLNTRSIVLAGSVNNTIINNTLASIKSLGITLQYSSYNTVINYNMTGVGMMIYGDQLIILIAYKRKGRSVKKTFIIILISLCLGCTSIPVRNDKIIPEKDNILKGSYLIMTNGWHKVEDERYVYIVDELIIAELWSYTNFNFLL